jgi:hypothetical protein
VKVPSPPLAVGQTVSPTSKVPSGRIPAEQGRVRREAPSAREVGMGFMG